MSIRIFIASPSEHLDLARALQEHFDGDRGFDVRLWDQDVFKLSSYTMEALIAELRSSQFGIFVLAPDDLTTIRGRKTCVARDNVVFELGLFVGHLGRHRSFVVAPRNVELHLPTDLLGMTVGNYDAVRSKSDPLPALGPVANKIRRAIKEEVCTSKNATHITRIGSFTDLDDRPEALFAASRRVFLYFIHSRRWRETHNSAISSFLARPRTALTVALPDLAATDLIHSLTGHFRDGPDIPHLIANAYRYFASLKEQYPRKVRLLLFALYPTYSLYRFDDTAIIAMYPVTALHLPVPTFEARISGLIKSFIDADTEELLKTAREPSLKQVRNLASHAR